MAVGNVFEILFMVWDKFSLVSCHNFFFGSTLLSYVCLSALYSWSIQLDKIINYFV